MYIFARYYHFAFFVSFPLSLLSFLGAVAVILQIWHDLFGNLKFIPLYI